MTRQTGRPATAQPIARGERAPDFALPRGEQAVRFYSLVGGQPAVLVLGGSAVASVLDDLVSRLRDADPGIAVHVVVLGENAGPDRFADPDGRVHQAYGAAAHGPPVAVALDPAVRVVSAGPIGDDAGDVEPLVAAAAAARHPETSATITRQAPVLLVPGVLDAGWQERLRGRWGTSAEHTGVEASTAGERREVADVHRKRRRDHTVEDAELLRELTRAVGRRLMPELQHAFGYRATRFEGFKIGCYEAGDRGFFEAHRDNLSPATAHRRFALSLNLNDDYEGGELRFPEYGRERYRPPAGGALVFSGSLLHEVLPVTRGRRFVLLSFLFADGRHAGTKSPG